MYGLSDDDASLLLVNIDWEKGVCPSESQFSKDFLVSVPSKNNLLKIQKAGGRQQTIRTLIFKDFF